MPNRLLLTALLIVLVGLLSAWVNSARAQERQAGRYTVATVGTGDSFKTLVVVLDTATGDVHPYMLGTQSPTRWALFRGRIEEK